MTRYIKWLSLSILVTTLAACSGVATKEIGIVQTDEQVENPAGQSSFQVLWQDGDSLAPKRVIANLGQDSDEFGFKVTYRFLETGAPESISWDVGITKNTGGDISKALLVAATEVAKGDDAAFTENFGNLIKLADRIAGLTLAGPVAPVAAAVN